MSKQPKVTVTESEDDLVDKAQRAVSQSNWVVGECAVKWTQKYARGRTDADFAALVGLSADQVFQRRRVWEVFGDVYTEYAALKWSHFYVALSWDDAPECLQWSHENESTVAEMKAWRRAQRGEDLTVDGAEDEWGNTASVQFVPSEMTAVRDPSEFGQSEGRNSGSRVSSGSGKEAVAGVARESDGGEYTPFRNAAGGAAAKEGSNVAVAEKPQASAEQTVARMASTLERINKMLTPQMLQQFRELPEKTRRRFLKAAGDLSEKITRIK